jgi:PP-loop superfamily ATP-utilizing enzyme
MARVEIAPDELSTWLQPAALARLTAAVSAAGFTSVALDARGFSSGGLNVLAGIGVSADSEAVR